ncbi:MAG: hypothetical protein CVV52_09195 [Spirochaetae bacterium HGW-Spirochaetae-8]|nr:MAG: hypothetical protein CVV55_02305 [Synergistetes bacterium HGW-Synergistetes-2]PKL12661.1 MAG: hypothetical protein CVV52_09195 [Spirochaetae bacterium HGW-Spirochaetae-8]
MLGKILGKVEYIILATLMLVTTALLFTNVALRYFFGSSLFWVEEVLRYCIVWITFIGISTCAKENSHISLDILMLVLPQKPKAYLKLVVHVVTFFASAAICYLSAQFVVSTYQAGQVSATIGGFPMYIVYSCLPLGFLLSSLRSLQYIIAGTRSQKPPVGPAPATSSHTPSNGEAAI